MNHLDRVAHKARVKAAASMPRLAAGGDIRLPRYELRLRGSGYWAVFRNGTYLMTTRTKDKPEADVFLDLHKLQEEADREGVEMDIKDVPATDIVDFAIRTYPKHNERSHTNVICALNRIRPHVEGRRLRDLKGDWLLATEEKMLETGRYGSFYDSVTRLIYAVRRYCKDRMSEAIIPFNRPPKSPGRSRVLEDFECDRVLRWTDGTEIYDRVTGVWTPRNWISKYDANCRLMVGRMMRLGLSLGSRPGVYDGMAWQANPDFGHIDLDNATLHRLPSGVSAEARKGAPAVALPPKLLGEIRRWKAFDGDGEYVFRTSTGGPLPAQTMREIFAEAMDHLGIEDVVPHTLRHTCITRMIERGLSASVISAICGITIDMLKRRYDHSDARVVQVIGHGVMDDLSRAAA